MIVNVIDENIEKAAEIHSLSWQESHKDFCPKEFIDKHNVKHQKKYLQNEINQGKDVFMLVEEYPVGIVSIKDNLIENLYVLPEEQSKGYGTKLLLFAINKCKDEAVLWILDNNVKAYNLYSKHGFIKTGKSNKLTDTLSEIEMKKIIG
ncbi:MAG: GNAT family N-acetyltransferase [Clostridium sp.]|nr:GNAT family N-acetyltransferase [Clostridium sp.]